jgi:uncharacterized membrane protein YeaQ/YmgE (transglycosylase-associated protein family)
MLDDLWKILPIAFIAQCTLLGMFGQFIRAMLGMYKVYIDCAVDTEKALSLRRFIASMMMGALAGLVCCLIFDKVDSKTDIMAVIGFGYMGADAIEGIFKKRGKAVYGSEEEDKP